MVTSSCLGVSISGHIEMRLPGPSEMVTPLQMKKEIKVSPDIHLTTALYAKEFFGDTIIIDNAMVYNDSKAKKRITYCFAVFDAEDKLIASAATTIDLNPDSETAIGSCMVRLPVSEIQRIRKYQITVYEMPPKTNP